MRSSLLCGVQSNCDSCGKVGPLVGLAREKMLLELTRLRGDRPRLGQAKGEDEATRGEDGLMALWMDPVSVSLRALFQTS